MTPTDPTAAAPRPGPSPALPSEAAGTGYVIHQGSDGVLLMSNHDEEGAPAWTLRLDGKVDDPAVVVAEIRRDLALGEIGGRSAAHAALPPIRWRPAPAPIDGSEFWAWRGVMGIRRTLWISAQKAADEDWDRSGTPCKAEDYEEGYSDADDHDDVWTPKWWVPLDEIAEPEASMALVLSEPR